METLTAGHTDLATTAARDAEIICLQSALLDHSGHVYAGMSRGKARRLVSAINALRAANGWRPLDMTGRGMPA